MTNTYLNNTLKKSKMQRAVSGLGYDKLNVTDRGNKALQVSMNQKRSYAGVNPDDQFHAGAKKIYTKCLPF